MVAELSGHDRKCWDLEALDMNLITLDAVAVTRIPLGHGEEDCWAWSAQSMDATPLNLSTVYCQKRNSNTTPAKRVIQTYP
jgi:hypothetical protein